MARMLFRLCVLACIVALSGCASRQYYTDASNPEIAITISGDVTYRGKIVDPEDLPSLLSDSNYPKSSTVNIKVADGLNDYRIPHKVMGILARKGYRRPILIGEKRSYSTIGKGEPTHRKAIPLGKPSSTPVKKTIRYK